MILEVLLIGAIIGIFVIVARRLPEALREGSAARSESSSVHTASKAPGISQWFFASRVNEKQPTQTMRGRSADTASEPVAAGVTDQSLLVEGDQLLADGKLREAERAFLRAVAKNPKNPKLYNRLGAIYLKQRNFSDALEAFIAARELDSSKASRHYNVALAAWQSGKRPLAREAIAQALSLDPTAEKYLQLKKEIEG